MIRCSAHAFSIFMHYFTFYFSMGRGEMLIADEQIRINIMHWKGLGKSCNFACRIRKSFMANYIKKEASYGKKCIRSKEMEGGDLLIRTNVRYVTLQGTKLDYVQKLMLNIIWVLIRRLCGEHLKPLCTWNLRKWWLNHSWFRGAKTCD